MDAELMLKEHQVVGEDAFVELVVWRLFSSVVGSKHFFKYRLALVVKGHCVLRYDNEQGKGDHKHCGSEEIPYNFTTPEKLIDDFWGDVEDWRY
jgi:Family of unknown function (DUF6516)